MISGTDTELRFDKETAQGLVSFQVRDNCTFIMMEQAHECSQCRAMRHFWINRAGVTICSDCDAVNLKAYYQER